MNIQSLNAGGYNFGPSASAPSGTAAPVASPSPAEEARTAERVQARQAEQKLERKETENAPKPKPVTNALGQQTGTLINVTA